MRLRSTLVDVARGHRLHLIHDELDRLGLLVWRVLVLDEQPLGRTAIALAEQLGQRVTVFPSHHGGFMGGEFGYAGQPEAFAAKLREVL